jgi:hypothetical protein
LFIARSFGLPLSKVADNLAMLGREAGRDGRLVDETGPLDKLAALFERFAAGQLPNPVCQVDTRT